MGNYCDECGCRIYGGICSNCCEELYIIENQADALDGVEFSEEFRAAAAEQRERLERNALRDSHARPLERSGTR